MFTLENINILVTNVSLFDTRDSEKKLLSKVSTKNRSFIEMFQNRLDKIKGKRKRISVKINVRIQAEDRNENYDNLYKKDPI